MMMATPFASLSAEEIIDLSISSTTTSESSLSAPVDGALLFMEGRA